jgi:hypothetical protein
MRGVFGSVIAAGVIGVTAGLFGQIPYTLANLSAVSLILWLAILTDLQINPSMCHDVITLPPPPHTHTQKKIFWSKLRQGSLSFIVWIIFAIVYLNVPTDLYVLRIFIVSIACFLLGKIVRRFDEQLASMLWILALSTFSFGVFYSLYHGEPLAWFAVQSSSQELSKLIGQLTHQQVLLNATASGILITFLMLIIGIFTFALSAERRWLPFAEYCVAIVFANLAFIAVLHPFYGWLQSLVAIPRFHIMDMAIFLFVLDVVPLSFYMKPRMFKSLPLKISPVNWKAVTALVVFATGMLLMIYRERSGFGTPLSAKQRAILIYGKGVFNLDKPKFGSYGLQSSGMFGILPAYLEAMGYNVRIDSSLSSEKLGNTGVVMVINLNKDVPASEKSDLQNYIYHGGSLLVIGDHTGLEGIMEPLNDLLQFVKIKYRFDCGHWLVDDWKDAFEIPAHPIFRRVKDETDIAISIGASLDFSPSTATPILFARYGFSDIGNPLNAQNAYLGNRRYDPDELLGDIVLIASANYGRGKVLVFGDTSPFQNGALTYSFQFVQNVFDWLMVKNATVLQPLRWISLTFMLIGFVLLFTIGRVVREPFAIVGGIVLIGVVWGILVLSEGPKSSITNRKSNLPIAYIDASHLNHFSQYEDDGNWPLIYNLMRNDYLPFVCRKFSPALLKQSKIAFFIAAEKELSADEVKMIDDYMRQGGTVIWSAGEENSDASIGILKERRLALDNLPLGPVSDSAIAVRFPLDSNLVKDGKLITLTGFSLETRTQFHSAWPIVVTSHEKVDTLCTGWSYPVIVSEQVGNGKFVLISDSGFFLNGNLENKSEEPFQQSYVGVNVMVFRGLMQWLSTHGS